MAAAVHTRAVETARDRRAFVDLPWRLYAADPNWSPPLKSEVRALIEPRSNPWFEHAEARFFLAEKDGRVVGRISAQVDQLVLAAPSGQGGGGGTGHWGMFEADDADTAAALIEAAEDWLRGKAMTRAMGPFSLSIWDEPGLLIAGQDHPPTVMMGHHLADYEGWIESAGYRGIKDLHTYELAIDREFPPLVRRIVSLGERDGRIRIRKVDKSRFDREASLILHILNDAWSGNWGYVPLTDAEIAHAGKKLKPIVFEDLVRVAEYDGEPVGFMIVLPNLNELTADLDGSLFPIGWARLLARLRKPRVRTMRVPLMGVVQGLQGTRRASQLAFMMIEYIRRASVEVYGASRGEIGWVLDDNQGMISIAEAIESRINKVYRIYAKSL